MGRFCTRISIAFLKPQVTQLINVSLHIIDILRLLPILLSVIRNSYITIITIINTNYFILQITALCFAILEQCNDLIIPEQKLPNSTSNIRLGWPSKIDFIISCSVYQQV